ncbi:MAG: DUF2062 domain-containing protein [Anaerolineae bacterium]|nr:DUF2062 domain-containing protein [Anaerolineae bacterium]
MPRRFFRKFAFKRHQLSEKWFLTPFRHMLHDHRLWGVRRKTVVPAFALGLFVAFVPLPGHFVFAGLLALLLHVNIPVAILSTFVMNPITMYPVFYFSYLVGADLLSIEPGPFTFELSLDWVRDAFGSTWLPLVVGCAVVGAVTSLVGYILLDVLWRYSLHDYKSKKRKKRSP